jgi:hypothetical protein
MRTTERGAFWRRGVLLEHRLLQRKHFCEKTQQCRKVL